MKVDLATIRKRSLQTVEKHGYSVLSSLPLLDNSFQFRSHQEVVERALAVHAVIACSYGFNKKNARAWVDKEKITQALTPKERDFLNDEEDGGIEFHSYVESLWALAWSLKLFKQLDFTRPADNSLVLLLPNLKEMENSDSFRKKTNLRSEQEIVSELDLAYCFHWVQRDMQVRQKKQPKNIHLIPERRRALEWIVFGGDWESISLDT